MREIKNKGITLISLVITIVVLLILAGVAISISVDEGGLFSKSGKAKNDWNANVIKEEEAMLKVDALMQEAGVSSNSDNEMIKYYLNEEVPIPKGFKYVEGTKETGIIIRDENNGNEFVWIPADADEIAEENAENLLYDETNYPQSHEMVESIRTYDGYYMARYSAGADVEITASGQMETVYSQAGKYRYNCGTLNQMMNLCKSMYPDNVANETGVLSHHQILGMTIEEVYKEEVFPESIMDIKEWIGAGSYWELDSGTFPALTYRGYNEYFNNLSGGSFTIGSTGYPLESAINYNLFSQGISFRPVLYIRPTGE